MSVKCLMRSEKPGTNTTKIAPSANSLPYASSRLGPNIELINLAEEIAHAEHTLKTGLNARLDVIAQQIRHLQQEAHQILEQAQRDEALHQVPCHFKRRPGKTYHLYEKHDGRSYFAMLSPTEWGGKPPHTYLGSFRLENDMSWTNVDSK